MKENQGRKANDIHRLVGIGSAGSAPAPASDCMVSGMVIDMIEPNVLLAPEVAVLLRLHVKTVYKLAECGIIPGKRIGRSWRFSHAEIVEFATSKPMGAPVPRLNGILNNWPKKGVL